MKNILILLGVFLVTVYACAKLPAAFNPLAYLNAVFYPKVKRPLPKVKTQTTGASGPDQSAGGVAGSGDTGINNGGGGSSHNSDN